jgi:hypothetical protein
MSATLHQWTSHAVHGLPVQMLLRLELRKTHALLGHSFGDGFSIEVALPRASPVPLPTRASVPNI